jgi:molybdenum-dependent DNA-binding transcriptional regulator ModE
MAKIEINRLQKIIREELENLREGADHDSAAKLMSAATKLINAIDSFKEAASEKAKAELDAHLASVEQTLSRIVSSPMQYVDVTKPPVKRVTLKPQKEV